MKTNPISGKTLVLELWVKILWAIQIAGFVKSELIDEVYL